MLGDKTMYVTSGVSAFKITANSCYSVVELDSNHEETDTRKLLDGKLAGFICSTIVIVLSDTDLLMIALLK